MSREGFVLVFTLLVVVAVELLVISSVMLATHEVGIADARVQAVTATRAAETALVQVRRSWPPAGVAELHANHQILVPSQAAIVTIERASWGLYHARARAQTGRISVERAAVLRTIDVQRATNELNEALAAAGPVNAPRAVFRVETARCDVPFVADRIPAAVTVARRYDAFGLQDVLIDSSHVVLPTGYAGLGIMWREVGGVADVQARGSITLISADSSGDPAYQLIYAAGNLSVDGGVGHGMLLVDGDLTISPNTQFTGVIVVSGRLTIHDGASITGAVRVQGRNGAAVGAATITYSQCAWMRAVLETPATKRLIKARRFYIPAY
jgi:hypothetical protein